ncbi:MAG: hypothetical protein QF437_33310 [Planctomycetota bacterium]|nr:hypothetical protein [Planctomycetota bacterium]MDP7135423.1 hypothetical protein [Planctomycetota bacterium]MDP7250951.1 hypothetical protein [Planctomycetota bacterium]
MKHHLHTCLSLCVCVGFSHAENEQSRTIYQLKKIGAHVFEKYGKVVVVSAKAQETLAP